jgi:peptidoglycan/xylan/chitin deacetylase (PgdA/CDA1 family)
MAIALTFDDGPDPHTTPQLLDLLEALNLHVTFFVLGQHAQANPGVLRRMAKDHEIGNHSWDHPKFSCLTDDQVRDQLRRTHDVIARIVGEGHAPKIMRPPYGEITAERKALISREFHYQIVGWDVDSEDWKTIPPAKIEKHILGHAKDGCTILAHDIHARTIAAMPATLRSLKSKFQLVTVSQLGRFTQGGLSHTPCNH